MQPDPPMLPGPPFRHPKVSLITRKGSLFDSITRMTVLIEL